MPERNLPRVVKQTEEARRQDEQRQAGVKCAITVGHLGTPYRRPVGPGPLTCTLHYKVYAFKFEGKSGARRAFCTSDHRLTAARLSGICRFELQSVMSW